MRRIWPFQAISTGEYIYIVGQRWDIAENSILFPVGWIVPSRYHIVNRQWEALAPNDNRGFYTAGDVSL